MEIIDFFSCIKNGQPFPHSIESFIMEVEDFCDYSSLQEYTFRCLEITTKILVTYAELLFYFCLYRNRLNYFSRHKNLPNVLLAQTLL